MVVPAASCAQYFPTSTCFRACTAAAAAAAAAAAGAAAAAARVSMGRMCEVQRSTCVPTVRISSNSNSTIRFLHQLLVLSAAACAPWLWLLLPA
jgi:hypothetical protein